MNFKGKKIIITGGSSGIGRALAIEVAGLGADVAIIGLNQSKIDEVVKELSRFQVKSRGYLCDLGKKDEAISTFAKIFEEFKTVDVLVNNAGFATYHTFHETSLDDLEHLTLVNYMGFVYSSKLVLDEMVKQKSGHVINVASVAGILPITPNATYCAAKHAMVALTDTLRCEYARFNISFSLMLPGRVDTPFFDHISFKTRNQRPEHAGMLSAQAVAQMLAKLIDSKTELVVTPKIFYFIRWAYQAFPWICGPLLRKVLRKRISEYYQR